MWVREGLAMHFAGESPAPLDGPLSHRRRVRRAATREAMAAVYRRARRASTALARGALGDVGVVWAATGANPS